MQIEIQLHSNIFADDDAPAQAKAAYRDAVRDRATSFAVERVVTALATLVDEAVRSSVLADASIAAAHSGKTVIEELRQHELALLAQVEAARSEFKVACDARQAEMQPALASAAREFLALGDQAQAMQARISGFAREQAATLEKYKSAGLSAAEIESIGIKPTGDDIAAWQLDLEHIRAREGQLSAFIKNGPFHDMPIPEGLTNAAGA